MVRKKKTINFKFGDKHKDYIRSCTNNYLNVAEGAVRAGKTVDNIYAFAHELKTTQDRIHLATGSVVGNAKLNIGDCNGLGLEHIFRGQCHWGKYKSNECLYIKGPSTNFQERIVIFAGGGKADSYKKIRGNSYGMWIATEINLHHQDTIKEAFNRTIAAKKRKVFWDLNPDNPKAFIYRDYIDLYRDKAKEGTLLGGYNYRHFTIDDNITISDERKEEIKSQYDKNSIWYQRDILGKRCVAEGLIYRTFANNTDKYIIDKPSNLMEINIGVDFGGNGSGHAFVATGINIGYKGITVLESNWYKGSTDPEELNKLFIDFLNKILIKYGYITCVYCDSAEQVLIRGLKKAAIKEGLGNIRIKNALKTVVNDRIRLVTTLIGSNRFSMTRECESLKDAMCGAVWDTKQLTQDVRLDDGTSDIDTMDAFEYSIERESKRLMQVS